MRFTQTFTVKEATASMGKLKLQNCDVTQAKNRRVAAAPASMTGSLTITSKSVCCNCSVQNAPPWSQYTGYRLLKSEQREQEEEKHSTDKEVNAFHCAKAECCRRVTL